MSTKTTTFAALGECMIELREQGERTMRMDFAGDTYNVALYLARYQQHIDAKVSYVTALGDDPYSDWMLADWQREHIDTAMVQRLANKLPGLYFIRTDERGERRFYYYRSQSAARELFRSADSDAICQQLVDYNMLYFSGISLAILDDAGRDRLFEVLTEARRRGATIVFDTNYRPSLWPDSTQAQQLISRAISLTDIGLPTFEDASALFGDGSAKATGHRWQQLGVGEVVVKCGASGCVVFAEGQDEPVDAELVTQVVDTTAAGDSFNAGYLAARLKGLPPVDAARCGHRLAAAVVAEPGAIIPTAAMPTLF